MMGPSSRGGGEPESVCSFSAPFIHSFLSFVMVVGSVPIPANPILTLHCKKTMLRVFNVQSSLSADERKNSVSYEDPF
jgi:hypothetical protein